MEQAGFAVIGAGYWGPNLVRNIATNPRAALRWVCDLREEQAKRLASIYAGVGATSSVDEVLNDPHTSIVAIATPASTHADLAIQALQAGKHVLIEKPLASSVADANKMIAVAEEAGQLLMCDHTYCYSPAVRHIKQVVEDGELGEILFVDSVRINLGLVQPDVNVLWDLAPHDLSILDFVLPSERAITGVAATGSDPIGAGQECVAHLALQMLGGASAHVHVNWLSPTKVRTMIIGGSRRTLVWDDLNPSQRVTIYDRGVDLRAAGDELAKTRQISYRIGDIASPALSDSEALGAVIDEVVDATQLSRTPLTDGRAGLRVLQILEASDESLRSGGVVVPVRNRNGVAS